MIEVVKLKREHLKALIEQPMTAYLTRYLDDAAFKALEDEPLSYTCLYQGKPVLVGGIVMANVHRGEAWAIIDQNCREQFLFIHRAVEKFLNNCGVKRVEAAVEVDFEAGHRWVEALGFKLEAPVMKAYKPNGGDCSLYSRIMEDS